MTRAIAFLLLLVLVAGCLSRSDTPGPEEPTPVPVVAEPEPTGPQPTAAQPTAAQPTAAQPTAAQPTAAQPTPELDPVEQAIVAQERVDAAVAALDASIEAQAGVGGLVSYQLRESAVDADGLVSLTLCGQRADIDTDALYDSSFFTIIAADGTITATHNETFATAGSC